MCEAIGLDFQNCVQTGDKAMTLTGGRIDGHSVPCVLILNSSGGGVAGTLDSYYFLGQGARGNIEREFVVVIKDELPREDRSSDGE